MAFSVQCLPVAHHHTPGLLPLLALDKKALDLDLLELYQHEYVSRYAICSALLTALLSYGYPDCSLLAILPFRGRQTTNKQNIRKHTA